MVRELACSELASGWGAGTTGGASSQELSLLFRKALAYAQSHFDFEEGLLRDSHYPHLLEQEQAHRNYLQQVEALVQPAPGSHKAISMDMLQFLKDWWLNHILKMDRAYAPFLPT